jgi:hypothetical protein
MFYIASPAAAATGQVLLQTSLHPQQPEMRALDSAINEVCRLISPKSLTNPAHLRAFAD